MLPFPEAVEITIQETSVKNELTTTRDFLVAILFIAATTVDVPELRLTPYYCSGMSLVCSKVCDESIQRPHIETCPVSKHSACKIKKEAILKKGCSEQTKSTFSIYDKAPAKRC
ncbi:hypothetical protein T4B_14867 [Trichinella pseudospiralis]|uniref:Uncharacterized protein n=1 Tax=Trichinella pseudospiralis TaxID=6337 RepID=A0A0V1HBC3_TRIPS|nr:hypothetical protein T4A_10693 [Trichinella pseudospiralis]KRZ08110.1 hypothetical protein T4B_14867 [Trichinella pseudospiralis]